MSLIEFIRKLFKADPQINYGEVVREVNYAFNREDFTVQHVYYYASKFRKEGIEIPYRFTL